MNFNVRVYQLCSWWSTDLHVLEFFLLLTLIWSKSCMGLIFSWLIGSGVISVRKRSYFRVVVPQLTIPDFRLVLKVQFIFSKQLVRGAVDAELILGTLGTRDTPEMGCWKCEATCGPVIHCASDLDALLNFYFCCCGWYHVDTPIPFFYL